MASWGGQRSSDVFVSVRYRVSWRRRRRFTIDVVFQGFLILGTWLGSAALVFYALWRWAA